MTDKVILVVDDEPGVLRLSQRLLEREGYQMIAVASPSQALAVLARQRVDLLLVDIRMPSMDGFQLMTLARRQYPEMAVVIMTGYGTVETAVEALHRGADGLILKPFTGAEFVQGVESALQEKQRKQEIYRLRTLRTLFDLTEALFSETELEKLVQLILGAICEHSNCEIALLYERKSAEETLTLIGQKGELEPEEISWLETELAQPAESIGSILWISRDDTGDDRQHVLEALLSDLQLASVFCTSVLHPDGDRNHVILAARKAQKPAFEPTDYEMFAILARQAAVALENASLYEALRNYVSQLEKSQRALIQVEKLATAGRLTASIAHEINNPLQSVQNCLYLASRSELSGKERHKYLELAQSELDHLMGTVQRMLDLYRPGVRDRQLVNIDDLVQRVLLLVEQQLKKGGVAVQTCWNAGPTEVTVVRSQIQQVLLNLILNAMEAMPVGGTIYIETARKKEKVEILISDDGPGIPEVVREHLFEPFASTKENGTGLGLAVSYGIITAHGGSLDLVPGSGKGACFQILLPVGDKS